MFSDTNSTVKDYGALLRETASTTSHDQDYDQDGQESSLFGIESRVEMHPLDQQLRRKLVPYVGDEAKFFLPVSDLDQIVRHDTVRHFLEFGQDREYFLSADLKGRLPSPGSSPLDQITQYICGNPESEAPVELKAARRVFAVLSLIGKATAIVDFILDSLCDEDLPLLRTNKVGAEFKLARKSAGVKPPLTCFKYWNSNDILQFDSHQWYMKSPFFAIKDGKATFYTLEDRTILPWRKVDKPVTNTDYSVVRRVQIHEAHHGFSKVSQSASTCILSLAAV